MDNILDDIKAAAEGRPYKGFTGNEGISYTNSSKSSNLTESLDLKLTYLKSINDKLDTIIQLLLEK